ncbi:MULTISPECIES: P27 family phage terminase small subunit [Actinomycetes]|uniref:P27 family phage terminase small subunit n=1 Tax=Actinomycetes TaxID=1760 RepID=UPI000D52D84D|nr:P27 family phage terminase small subunit [Trueperella pyogenes]MCI6574729.1 P27 family phage terminase small subunit [Arcanobacterium sp.]MCQ9343830.1 P27 family phage terminase small subunit [Corynebacterium sp. 76QC2CO]AWG03412.1 terminase [Trueperella pyogenes]AWG16143.1 terminase [Trueperella pyogenes]AZR05026.1 terminase [Trueperella pyogenes]
MARDGTNRGGRRVKAGRKPDALHEKLADGRPATRLTPPEPQDLDLYDFTGTDVGDGVELSGSSMPPPADYLSAEQRDGKPLGADLVYRETWAWLDERGCTDFVSKRLIESYAQAFARYVQCEEAISKFGLLGKHPTTGAAIASPFVAMSQSFSKQANVYWYEIYEIVRATCTTDFTASTSPQDDVMEKLLKARS